MPDGSCFVKYTTPVRKASGIRVIAPELDENEVYDFLRARKLTPCGSCLREYVVMEIPND